MKVPKMCCSHCLGNIVLESSIFLIPREVQLNFFCVICRERFTMTFMVGKEYKNVLGNRNDLS